MNRLNIKLIIFLILASSFAINAQTKVLSLDEAIKLGLENSHQLKISNNNLNAATEKYKDYESQVYPSVKATAGYTRLSPVAPFTFEFPGSSTVYTFFPVYLNSYSSQIAAYEPFYNGLRAKNTLKSQYFLEQAAKFDYDKDKSDIIYNIINAYYNIYKIKVSKALIDENIEQINQHIKETQDYEKNGLAVHNDVLRVELQKSNAEFTRLDLQNNLEVAIYNYNILLGIPPDTKTEIDSNSLFSVREIKSLDDYIKDAMNNRGDIKASDSRSKASESNLEVTKGSYLPQLGVGADLYYANPNPRLIPPDDIFKETWDAGIYFSYDISSLYTNKHKVAQSKIQVEQSKENYNLLLDNARMEINQSYTAYNEALKKIELSKTTIVDADENYKTEHSRYTNHVALLSDLLDANVALLQAKMNLALSNADAELSYYKLMKSIGNTK
jgi:outer membrane protein